MTNVNWKIEFPDFTDMPIIPEGFTDTSWHNDVCPSFTSDQLETTIWVDYTDSTEREMARSKFRFCVEHQKDGIETGKWCLWTNDWNEVINIVNLMRKPCKFTFDDETLFDGFEHGSEWNGFDNVAVTRETLDLIIAHFVNEEADEETLKDLRDLEPICFGLYSLGYGYTTTIVRDLIKFARDYARSVGRA